MAHALTTWAFPSATPGSEAFEEWEARMQQSYFPLAVMPHHDAAVSGRLTFGSLPGPVGLGLTDIYVANQEIRRSKGHVAAADDEYLLVSMQTVGRARLDQNGRSVLLAPGEMTFLDSSRPSCWTVEGECEQVLVQVPIRRLRELPGLGRLRMPTAIAMPADSAAAVVSNFFHGLSRVRRESPEQADILAHNALDLLASAVLLAAGERPVDTSADALRREQVITHLRRRCADPDLTFDEVARACHISRRTLFRIFGGTGESLNTTLRRMRVRRAKDLLARDHARPPTAVAFDSGFATERNFYRAFHQETGMTPGEYRQTHLG
ncbi:helix-turn-helix domain-containing protein [Nocardia sp. NPDC058176]|uniref:AraC-like ligand-binding domain-containing protein n=1 Tax=Nocardia sp. NPDC058176 TaxID=3346368 RepID=UPI0036DBE568